MQKPVMKVVSCLDFFDALVYLEFLGHKGIRDRFIDYFCDQIHNDAFLSISSDYLKDEPIFKDIKTFLEVFPIDDVDGNFIVYVTW